MLTLIYLFNNIRCRIFTTCLTTLFTFLLSLHAAPGVPHPDIDYNLDVQSWWAQQPFNPDSPNFDPCVQSPSHTVTLTPGQDIQTALDALPPSGGTIKLPPGSYSGFNIINRQHLHFIGSDDVTITGRVNIRGCSESEDYGGFSACAHQRDPDCLDCLYHQPTRDIYFRNLHFSQGTNCRTSRGVMWDHCTFTGPSPTAHAVNNDLWYRHCTFAGTTAEAVYWDGVHAGGFLHCTFGPDYKHMLFRGYTNDDFTWDYNNDETWSGHEVRKLAYIVFHDNTFGPVTNAAVIYAGSNLLLQRNRTTGPMRDFARVDGKFAAKDYTFNSYDLVLLCNQAPHIENLLHLLGPQDRPTEGLPHWYVWTKYNIGRYIVKNNLLGPETMVVFEEVRDGKIDGPNIEKNNGPDIDFNKTCP